jgi:hypothetical protein
MATRSCRAKRNRLASRRRLNTARPTEGRILFPTAHTTTTSTSPLVRLLLVQSLDREGHLLDPRLF